MSKRGLSARHSVPNQTLSLVNFRLPKGNPMGGNGGRPGGYGGLPSGFHARKGGPGRNSRPSRRPARAVLKRRNVRRRSRGALRPSFAIKLPPSKQRAQGRPGACCTRGPVCDFAQTKTCTRAYRAARAFRPSLRNGFTAYFVLFPENGSFASVASETDPANLTPAPRRPNHTTSPYA